jgi:hypothetical protein
VLGTSNNGSLWLGLGCMLDAVGVLDAIAGRVAAGATVEFRPSGTSMVPLINSRQLVTVAPVDPAKVEVGDIVLAKVAGTVYLHLVSALDNRGRVQIGNNRGPPTAGPPEPGSTASVPPWTVSNGHAPTARSARADHVKDQPLGGRCWLRLA